MCEYHRNCKNRVEAMMDLLIDKGLQMDLTEDERDQMKYVLEDIEILLVEANAYKMKMDLVGIRTEDEMQMLNNKTITKLQSLRKKFSDKLG